MITTAWEKPGHARAPGSSYKHRCRVIIAHAMSNVPRMKPTTLPSPTPPYVCQMGMFRAATQHVWPRILTSSSEEEQCRD